LNSNTENEHESEDRPLGRFNHWGERKLLTADKETQLSVQKELDSLDINGRAKSLLWQAKITSSSGYEFVFISNAQFEKKLYEHTQLEIRPCFIPLDPRNPKHDDQQAAMMRRGYFVYDGWYPVGDVLPKNAEFAVETLDRITSIFSIVGNYFSYWEPKYWYSIEPVYTYYAFQKNFQALDRSLQIMQSLPDDDARAIGRILAWLTNASRTDAVQKFLLLFATIESLATYLEGSKSKRKSILKRTFSSPKASRSDRKKARDDCIDRIMGSRASKAEKIQNAYFDCIHRGISVTLSSHLENVFQGEDESKALFIEEFMGKTLWDLRNEVAHGNIDLLNDEEVHFIYRRTPTLEKIAWEYIRVIFSRLAKSEYFPEPSPPAMSIPFNHSIATKGAAFSVENMAEYYANVDAMTRSFVHMHFDDG